MVTALPKFIPTARDRIKHIQGRFYSSTSPRPVMKKVQAQINGSGCSPRLDLIMSQHGLQPRTHDAVVTVHHKGKAHSFHIFVKNHKWLRKNNAVRLLKAGVWRGDILVMRKDRLKFLNMTGDHAVLADYAVKRVLMSEIDPAVVLRYCTGFLTFLRHQHHSPLRSHIQPTPPIPVSRPLHMPQHQSYSAHLMPDGVAESSTQPHSAPYASLRHDHRPTSAHLAAGFSNMGSNVEVAQDGNITSPDQTIDRLVMNPPEDFGPSLYRELIPPQIGDPHSNPRPGEVLRELLKILVFIDEARQAAYEAKLKYLERKMRIQRPCQLALDRRSANLVERGKHWAEQYKEIVQDSVATRARMTKVLGKLMPPDNGHTGT
ncbi:hypothetical protein CVT26_008102 [Gymnopilus dilepis]|uniref:Uncharacterized protein n=1 Tax=Gymnopilus dilepis TaxID=231916 RepID=A0A409WWH2_9AGAR|nr:hypothetical protein CVT26_008102 [Gymnopilus dilepis]